METAGKEENKEGKKGTSKSDKEVKQGGSMETAGKEEKKGTSKSDKELKQSGGMETAGKEEKKGQASQIRRQNVARVMKEF